MQLIANLDDGTAADPSFACRAILDFIRGFRLLASTPRFHAAVAPSRLTVAPASRIQAAAAAAEEAKKENLTTAIFLCPSIDFTTYTNAPIHSSCDVTSDSRWKACLQLQSNISADICLPPSAALRNMLADTLRLLDLRTLTVSVQETDATTLLNFLRRLHGHPRQRPFIASAQINIFLSRNDPANQASTRKTIMMKTKTKDEDDKGEGDEDEEDEDDGDEDEDDEDEDDEDEDDEDEDDEDEDDEDEMEQSGRLFFWTDPTWSEMPRLSPADEGL
ncbi:hypothetical protein FA13DRAFT_1806777 [Coprinellus micaceus]|uniref:Uncharacterized protein n=1 Tax=Coprinellus micaceus TaxID=71717 RepID=A0A4Y7RJ89_COPMI|nr:hypothetical protein FA13DRAFT_1806777 [Coprinellus micaceus]